MESFLLCVVTTSIEHCPLHSVYYNLNSIFVYKQLLNSSLQPSAQVCVVATRAKQGKLKEARQHSFLSPPLTCNLFSSSQALSQRLWKRSELRALDPVRSLTKRKTPGLLPTALASPYFLVRGYPIPLACCVVLCCALLPNNSQ